MGIGRAGGKLLVRIRMTAALLGHISAATCCARVQRLHSVNIPLCLAIFNLSASNMGKYCEEASIQIPSKGFGYALRYRDSREPEASAEVAPVVMLYLSIARQVVPQSPRT